MTKVFVTGTM